MSLKTALEKIENDMNNSLVPGDFHYKIKDSTYTFFIESWIEDDKILASIECTFSEGFFYDSKLKNVNVSKYLVDNSK